MAPTTNSSSPNPKTKSKSAQNDPPSLSANFANSSSSPSSSSIIDYDHEIYLQLTTAGGNTKSSAAKTANQVYREERTKHRTTRALDPAILEPRGDPSSVDFECAEIQRKKDRVR